MSNNQIIVEVDRSGDYPQIIARRPYGPDEIIANEPWTADPADDHAALEGFVKSAFANVETFVESASI